MSLATEIAGKLNYLNTRDNVAANATLPYSGYTQVSKKLDNFVFQTSSSFLNKVADNNRYVKFGEKVVDTYGPELITNGDFSNGTTGWTARIGVSSIENINNRLKVTRIDSSTLYARALFDNTNLPLNKRCVIKAYITANENVGKIYVRLNNGSDIELVSSTPYTGHTEIYTTSGTAYDLSYIAFSSSSTGSYITIDNISVREIQTAQFTVPNVTGIITNGSNTTSVAVNAGDYVVDGSELVVNGTFDSDTSGWVPYNGATLRQENGELKITGTDIDYPYAEQTINTVIGQTYQVVLGKNSGSVANVLKVIGSTAVILFSTNEVGAKTFVATASTTKIRLENATSTNNTVSYWDNISVKRVSNTFRAKQNAPIGTALTNTAYFEDRTQIGVTNQQLAYHAYNTLTNSYEGIKVETLFSDVSKEDLLDNSVWMARNGFSKVSEFLYSKGSYLCLPVGIWQSLNKGAYHPVLNSMGVSAIKQISNADHLVWYESLGVTKLLNTIDCFRSDSEYQANVGLGAIVNGGSWAVRPDSKFYDICYPDQFIDVREYAKVLNPYEVDLIRADKEENGVSEITSTEQVTQTTTGTVATLEVGNNANYKVGSVLQIWNGTTPYRRYVVSVSGNTVTLDNTIYKTAVPFIIGGGKLPILSSGTKLSIDIIGASSNYPQVFKDRLASGVGIVGINPILISDTGVNLIPDGTSKNYKVSKKSTSDAFNYVTLSSGEVTGGGAATTINVIGNYVTASYLATDGRLFSYTSKNNPYIQTTPKPVVEVLPKVKASNSHSIYKGALVGNQVSGKVQVGNGSNGYESKVLENIENINIVNSNIYLYLGETLTILTNQTCTFIGFTVTINGVLYNKGSLTLKRIGSNLTNAIIANPLTVNPSDWSFVSYYDKEILNITPTHSTIAIDNANSPASKWFECLEEGNNGVLAGVYGQEVVYGADTGNFANLSNGTTTDFSNNTVRTFHGSIPLNGKIK